MKVDMGCGAALTDLAVTLWDMSPHWHGHHWNQKWRSGKSGMALFELHLSSHSGKQFSYLDCWVPVHHVQTVHKQMEMKCSVLGGKVSRGAWYSVISWALWVEMHKWYQSRELWLFPWEKCPRKLQRLAIGARSGVRFALGWRRLVSLKNTYAKQKPKSLTGTIHHLD